MISDIGEIPNTNKIKVIDKKLGRQKAVGQAYTDARVIEIDPRQTSKNYLVI